MRHVVIGLTKCERSIGNIYFHEYGSTLLAINEVIKYIDNYNSSLINAFDPYHEPELLAARFFDVESKDGVGFYDRPEYCNESFELMKTLSEKRSDFPFVTDRIYMRNSKNGVVAIVKNDRFGNVNRANSIITINLDENYVQFGNLVKEYTPHEFETMKETTVGCLAFCPFQLDRVPFNELCDLHDFVIRHLGGFRDEYNDELVYAPYL